MLRMPLVVNSMPPMPDPITIYVQPGESISQALIRAMLVEPPGEGRHEVITIPPGVHIVERRTTGVPFLNCAGS